MPAPRPLLWLLIAILLIYAPLHAVAATPRVEAPPLGERWFSINIDGERVGFSRLSITKERGGYRIDSEGSVKLRVMGFSREATSRESYLVGPDLALLSFSADNRIDGSPQRVKGEVSSKGIKVLVENGGKKKEQTLKAKGAVYPPAVLNIFPLMKGAAAGQKFKVSVLDVESVKVKQVSVKVIGMENLAGVAALHLQNDLYPMVDNDVWVDLKGNVVRESVRDDLVVTLAEEESTAQSYLADAALAKKDLVLDYSLIKVSPPIDRPDQLKRLSVEFTGFPEALPLLQGKGQRATKLADGRVLFTMPNPDFAPPRNAAPAPSDLAPTPQIPSDAPEIASLRDEILGAEKDTVQRARLLVNWVAKEINGTVTDSRSPLETLKKRQGNCQGHARLYTALARAAGIPTRFVSGVVYSAGQGFLYHSWAESYLNGWVPVDPTFGETPANPTHIKLAEGDSPDEMAVLAGVIGRVRARIVEQGY